ncbi:MAG: NAD-dependent epimerase/dehydratase family protein [Deltaproteobacteria bacterium]|nr:NAD-dependent epimerase/dehydratase family protein [Deltaproteobacteria bacterium]
MPQADYSKALVTGGAGFIGSHIAERLIKEGVDVSIIDDLSMGSHNNIPAKAVFHEGSILDTSLMKKALDGVDVVFHNAARVSIRNSFDDIFYDTQTNVLGTVNLLKAAGKAKIKKFIYASSMAVYGSNAELPIKEDSVIAPISPYGVGKFAGEEYVRQMSEYYGFENVTLRYFNTYGIRQTFTPYVGVITIFIRKLLQKERPIIFGTGNQIRDFIFVEDITDGNFKAMNEPVNNRVINLGSGKGTPVMDIANILIDRLQPGIQPEYQAMPLCEPKDSVADISTARQLLKFEPTATLEDKIEELIDWNRHALNF